ncbi:MAG: hypothetical protein WDN10_04635 [bacterium]
MQSTVAIIRPEAIGRLPAIRGNIAVSGLTISRETSFYCDNRAKTEEYVGHLLYRVPGDVIEATVQSFLGYRVSMLLITGRDAIERFRELAGAQMSPGECGTRTLRYLYGVHHPDDLGDGLRYWKNGVLRPANQDEARWDASLFECWA